MLELWKCVKDPLNAKKPGLIWLTFRRIISVSIENLKKIAICIFQQQEKKIILNGKLKCWTLLYLCLC